ncbi:MAG: acyl-CoA thioesterase [Clostridia bacterium]|nr:acyl-CoA thioesterase [Clostridia bacterium]
MGIVHHSNYIRWFEEARVDYLERIGFSYEKAVESCIDFAVLSVSCEYKSMTRFGETVKILLCVPSLSAAQIILAYQVIDTKTGTLRAAGESRHCFFHSQKKRLVSLKKELPELYKLLQECS